MMRHICGFGLHDATRVPISSINTNVVFPPCVRLRLLRLLYYLVSFIRGSFKGYLTLSLSLWAHSST